MFGLACKGLHCAGCGKGIPASVFVLAILIAVFSNGEVQHAIAGALLIIAGTLAGCAIITSTIITHLTNTKGMLNGRWEGPMMAEVKEAAEWPNVEAGNAFHNSDPIGDTIPVPIREDTWTKVQ